LYQGVNASMFSPYVKYTSVNCLELLRLTSFLSDLISESLEGWHIREETFA